MNIFFHVVCLIIGIQERILGILTNPLYTDTNHHVQVMKHAKLPKVGFKRIRVLTLSDSECINIRVKKIKKKDRKGNIKEKKRRKMKEKEQRKMMMKNKRKMEKKGEQAKVNVVYVISIPTFRKLTIHKALASF